MVLALLDGDTGMETCNATNADPAYIQNHANSSEVFWQEFFLRNGVDLNTAVGELVKYIDQWNHTSMSWDTMYSFKSSFGDATFENNSTIFR